MSSSFERRAFADQLSIETPEQVALEFPVAGIGSRFVALLLDHLLQFAAMVALAIVVGVVLAAMGDRGMERLSGKWFLAGVTVIFFLIIWGYFALFEAFWQGQTPGKRAMKLRVIKDSGRQITLFEALTRNLLRFVDYLPGMYLAGVITMLCNRRNKRLGDLAAGTMVIHEQQEAQPLLWSGVAPPREGSFGLRQPVADAVSPAAAAPALFPGDAVARLNPADLRIVETFFARALDLPLETRAQMAYRILADVCARMGVAAPEGNPERALEALATQMRAQGRRFGA